MTRPVDKSGSFRPFEDLGRLLREKTGGRSPGAGGVRDAERPVARSRKPVPPKRLNPPKKGVEDSGDRALFQQAMADVVPMAGKSAVTVSAGSAKTRYHPPEPSMASELAGDADAVRRLRTLVDSGVGFIVEHTPEYKEWTGFNVNPWITRRLRRGEFAIQEYIDLHGLAVDDAKHVFDRFLKAATRTGRQSVLIVHGRGLSSPTKPVLKAKVFEWLTSGTWRKWVIAFSSARLCDGGAGATYVLLRHQPLPKRFRTRTQIRS